MNGAAVKGVGSRSSAEGSVKLRSCSEDSPVRFGLICQFAVILLPQLCRVTVRIASEGSWELLTWRVYARPRNWFTSGQSLLRQTECLSSTNNTSYEDLSSYDNLPRCSLHNQTGLVKIGLTLLIALTIYFKRFKTRDATNLQKNRQFVNCFFLKLNILYSYIHKM